MAAGGKREGAGRPKGARDKPIYDPGGEQGKLMPLDLMLSVVRDESAPMSARLEQAKQCAPYCSAKLVSKHLEVDADVNIELISYLDE